MADNENKVAETEVKEAQAKDAVKKADSAKPDKPKKDKIKFSERVKRFFREYKSEMKKIVWYSRKDTIKSTTLVVVAIVISAAFIGVLDFGFSKLVLALGSLV